MTDARENMSYREIKEIVLERIRNRDWPPDSLLPNEADLAEEFSSTRTTVNRALRELAEDGYLERRRKAGTRVLEAPVRQAKFAIPLVRKEVETSGATYRYALVERKVLPAPGWLSARLNLLIGQDVLYVRCMHYADNRPFQLETRWVVIESVPEILDHDFTTVSPNAWLLQKVPVTNLELSFTATRANEEVAGYLDADAGDPIFTAERTTWLRGSPVTFAKLHFVPGYRMTTQL